MTPIFILLSLFISIVFFARLLKMPLRKLAYKLAYKMSTHSLRTAIVSADKIKNDTGRKTIVVYNSTKNEYEPIEKKLLKKVANASKSHNTKGGNRRLVNHSNVKSIEKNALYVTR